MTPRDYARASIKYYSNMRSRRLQEEARRSRIRELQREESEFNTSALVSYRVEDYSTTDGPVLAENLDDLGGYGRLDTTVAVIHTRPKRKSPKHRFTLSGRLHGLQEHAKEGDDVSGISLDVDRGTLCDNSSTSSKPITPQHRITRRLNRTLHVITSTISNQDTFISTGSSSVFQPRRARPARANSTFSGDAPRAGSASTPHSRPSSSRRGYSTSPNDRSTPSLWYENIRSPIKASKQVFRGMLADLQHKTSSTFGGKSARSARGPSDADDLNLNDHVYTGRLSTFNRSEDGPNPFNLRSFPTEEDEDDIFPDPLCCSDGTVFPNHVAISGDRISRDTPSRRSDRISRDDPVRSGAIPKSQSDGNISGFGFDPKIQFNNFVLDTKI